MAQSCIRWSEYIVTARLGNYQEVVGLLVHMFRAAATMSPAQSEGTSVQTHSKEASAELYMGLMRRQWKMR
ncbi:hypothetical protein N7519_005975 [Penicillium mononematosum]|uniref:uncharacterized protein n=1 Tax=Penicillium mononematosum TaxID=268346 RepID=UPI002546CFBF|nr:uncharacterized protein N7519_005975 [Penicillium mononematosum]KAJ6184674.1 hypothetical protein N7519_005975 [Penicillium mononematosum]